VVEEFRNFAADSLFVEANKLKLQNINALDALYINGQETGLLISRNLQRR
jgi:hypothetical protein